MAPNLDPRSDYLFKRLFGDEDQARVLVALLNGVLELPGSRLVQGVGLLQQPELSSEGLNRLADQDLVQLEDSLNRQLSAPKQGNGRPPTNPT